MPDTAPSLPWYDIVLFPELLKRYQAFKSRHSTRRGQVFILLTLISGTLGINTEANLVFVLFSGCLSLLAISLLFKLLTRLDLTIERMSRLKTTAGQTISYSIVICNKGRRSLTRLSVEEEIPHDLMGDFRQDDNYLPELAAGEITRLNCCFSAKRRGIYTLPGIKAHSLCPMGLFVKEKIIEKPLRITVFPQVYPIDHLQIPSGRSYQPGGMPLASRTGESLEFMGLREYRPGDNLRDISWSAFARLGKPVVREYLDEYFSRVAIVLDTHIEAPSHQVGETAFEASVSLTASIVHYLFAGEYIIDILAAGPDLLELSSGRALAQFENVLELLACVQIGNTAPMEVIDPHLQDILQRLTALIMVFSDWDEKSQKTYKRLRGHVDFVKAIVVRGDSTTLPMPEGEMFQRISPDNLAEEILQL